MFDEKVYLKGIQSRAKYSSEYIRIYEWPTPVCEIEEVGKDQSVQIKTREDAIALRDSLNRFIKTFEEV